MPVLTMAGRYAGFTVRSSPGAAPGCFTPQAAGVPMAALGHDETFRLS
jgi:hypothetical protein